MKHHSLGFTLIELLVVISIIAILASLAIPAVLSALTRGQMTGTLSSSRQIQLATQNSALDAAAQIATGIGWPGDAGTTTVQAFATMLVSNEYLTGPDLAKFIGNGPGIQPATATDNTITVSSDNVAFTVFNVRENSDLDRVFLVTKNWSANTLGSNAPYGEKGFIVMRKGGDGSVLRRAQAGDTNLVKTEGQTALTE